MVVIITTFERAKQVYKKRKEDAKEKTAKLLREIHWFKECDKNNGDKCEHGRCKYAKLVLGENVGIFCNRNDNIKD